MTSRARKRRALSSLIGLSLLAAAVAVAPFAPSAVASAATQSPSASATPAPTPTPTATPAEPRPFTTVGTPVVTGTGTVGRTLTAATGAWRPVPSAYAFQWLRDGAPISGATSSEYVLVAADADRAVAVRVTASRAGYVSTTATSASKKIGRAFTVSPTPTITGTIAVGKTVTATHAAWAPAPVSVTYQWYRGATPISGATAATYRIVAADEGKALTVRTKGTKSGYTTVTVTSAARTVPRELSVPSMVALSGTPTVGSTLTASPGTWGPSPVTLKYQWLRNGSTISGATSRTYELARTDAGTEISVRVTGSKSGYRTVSRTSATIDAKWGFTSSPTPTVSGSVAAGRTLTASVGTWSPAPKLAYQWRVDGEEVSGATKSSWRVPEWAAGRSVTVSVTATRSGYLTVTRTSPKRAASWSLGDTLRPGIPMRAGTYLASPNGVYRFTVHGDGNVVLSKNGVAQRSTRTTGTPAAVLLLQEDGTLAVYSGSDKPVWKAGTTGYAVAALTLDDKGQLRLVEVDGLATWTGKKLAAFSDASAAAAGVPGKNGWAYPIRPSATMTTYSGHSGDDIAKKVGTPVYAMRGGKVDVQELWITSGCPAWAPNNTKQKQILVTTTIDGKTFELNYAHLSKFSVKDGQTVKAGQKIGEVGSTGCSTGPHLHLAIKIDGVPKLMYPRDVLGSASY